LGHLRMRGMAAVPYKTVVVSIVRQNLDAEKKSATQCSLNRDGKSNRRITGGSERILRK